MAMSTHRSSEHWVENWLRPLLIAAMMACLAAPLVQLSHWLAPDWDGTYFVIYAFLATLEGILSERLLRRQGIRGWTYLGSRAAEALLFLLLLKLLNYLPRGLEGLQADILLWRDHPYSFLSSLDLLTGGLFLVLWGTTIYVAGQASELDAGDSRAEPPPDKTSTEYYLWLTQPSPVRDRQQALERLGELFLYGGIVLLAVSSLVRALLPAAILPVLAILLYFALGVALLSQARFSVANLGWRVQGLAVQPDLARRWLTWVVVFLVGVALFALLLPTRYALGPVQALYNLLLIVANILMFLISGLFYLLALLLAWLMPQAIEQPEPPQALQLQPAVTPPYGTAAAAPWLEVLLSALFWLLILAIVGYALFRFLKDRSLLLRAETGSRGGRWARLLAWLSSWWQRWRRWQQEAQNKLVRRRAGQAARAPARAGAGFFSLHRLSPRELVRYFYLSAARRAAQAGEPRRPSQTPYEYRAALERHFPDLEPDLSGLTEAFVQARYGQRTIEPGEAKAVKPLWERIKAALRARRASS